MIKGNCIDKFISKRLDNILVEILNLRSKIRQRRNDRENIIDYFNSGCYEKDFSDIIKLRNISIDLTNKCNIFLERISEQYSKIN